MCILEDGLISPTNGPSGTRTPLKRASAISGVKSKAEDRMVAYALAIPPLVDCFYLPAAIGSRCVVSKFFLVKTLIWSLGRIR